MAVTRIMLFLKPQKMRSITAAWQGSSEIFEITDRKTQAFIKADIYAPHPEEVDPAVVTDYLHRWTVNAEVHQGGANPEGIALNGKPKTEITIAIVALTVYVDV